MPKLTIKEIAKMAGVSSTAVSFVINNKDGISEDTKRKVTEILDKTNFKPSVNSRRLFTHSTSNICVVTRATSSPFYNLFYLELARGFQSKATQLGFNIIYTEIGIKGDVVNLPLIIKQKETEGIIFLQDTEKKIINEIEKLGIPYIIVDSGSHKEGITTIRTDYQLSSYTATKYLIDNGHKNIAFIGSSYIPEYYLQAFSGFKKALEQNFISIPSSWIQIDAVDEQSAYKSMEKILRTASFPSAVFCSCDIFAIGAMKCTKNNGLKIPEDISFIGIDDILLCEHVDPSLTSVRIDKEKLGQQAVELIVGKIEDKSVTSIIFQSDNIIQRNSVKQIIS